MVLAALGSRALDMGGTFWGRAGRVRNVRKLLVVLYTALVLGANPVAADVAALREGDMKKLMLLDAAVPVPEAVPVADAAIQYGAGQCTHAVWSGDVCTCGWCWCHCDGFLSSNGHRAFSRNPFSCRG